MQSLADIVNKYNDGWFFANPYGHGDSWLICGLMGEFKKYWAAREQRPQHVTVILKKSHEVIAEMFPAIDRIVTVPDNELMGICRRNQSRIVAPNCPVVLHPHFLYDGQLDKLTCLEGFSDKDMFAHLLGLPLGAKLALPVMKQEWLDEAVRYAKDVGISPGRSVILIPDGSYPSPDTSFWTDLSVELREKGWNVFTNLYGNNERRRLVPFEGSKSICPPLEILLPLCDIAGWVVSTLTGVLAILFMAQIPCKKTVVAVGPVSGKEMKFNEQISFRHAYPFATQRKCSGDDYEAQEIHLTGLEDYPRAIKDIVEGYYGTDDDLCPNELPISSLFVPSTPGDLFDRISVLRIKAERITNTAALHVVKRSLLHLESILMHKKWDAESIISQLKKENEIGWEGIDLVYRGLDMVPIESIDWSIDKYMLIALTKKYRELRDSNKRRITLKKKADEFFGSIMTEQKTY